MSGKQVILQLGMAHSPFRGEYFLALGMDQNLTPVVTHCEKWVLIDLASSKHSATHRSEATWH